LTDFKVPLTDGETPISPGLMTLPLAETVAVTSPRAAVTVEVTAFAGAGWRALHPQKPAPTTANAKTEFIAIILIFAEFIA
jgi:hypothetical protein